MCREAGPCSPLPLQGLGHPHSWLHILSVLRADVQAVLTSPLSVAGAADLAAQAKRSKKRRVGMDASHTAVDDQAVFKCTNQDRFFTHPCRIPRTTLHI